MEVDLGLLISKSVLQRHFKDHSNVSMFPLILQGSAHCLRCSILLGNSYPTLEFHLYSMQSHCSLHCSFAPNGTARTIPSWYRSGETSQDRDQDKSGALEAPSFAKLLNRPASIVPSGDGVTRSRIPGQLRLPVPNKRLT